MILLTLMMYRFFFVIFSHIYYLNVCVFQWSELKCCSSTQCIYFFLCFWHNRYLKIREFQWKTKILEFLSIFQSFWVRNNISKGYIMVIFHSVSKIQLSAFLSVLPLSISQQNCRKFSEKMKIFNFWSNFLRFYA